MAELLRWIKGTVVTFSFNMAMTLHRLLKKKWFTDFKTVKKTKSHSARIQKPVLSDTDVGDVRVFLQQMLSVIYVCVNLLKPTG
jgi:hypothetical protein